MLEVNIIGTGNVAWHLAKAFSSENEIIVMQVAGRSAADLKDFEKFAQETTTLEHCTPSQVTIVAVSDDAIKDVLEKIPFGDSLVVHTSGFTEMMVGEDRSHSQKRNRKGVFYPLQSFSKGDPKIDFSEIPILIEAEDPKDEKTLKTLAEVISNNVKVVDSKQRRMLHLAAVFANNFTNHLYAVAQKLCHENDVSFELLHALIKKTSEKAVLNGPRKSQTGPAKRGDLSVIRAHEELLRDSHHQELYKTLTKVLRSTYGKEL